MNALIFDGRNEKLEPFEDIFGTMLKMKLGRSEEIKNNHFLSRLQKEALQTFGNKNASNKQLFQTYSSFFRRKYIRPQSQATAKHKWYKLTFDPNTKSLSDFREELNKYAERVFGLLARQAMDSFVYAKLSPHHKKLIDLAYLENGPYHQTVAFLE